MAASVLTCVAAAAADGPLWAGQTEETIAVELKLLTGGAVRGLVVDHTEHGIVVARGVTPYVFAWSEIEAGSAFRARRDLLVLERGGVADLTAADHFQLGRFALQRGRTMTARQQFAIAARLDPQYAAAADDALKALRRADPRDAGGVPFDGSGRSRAAPGRGGDSGPDHRGRGDGDRGGDGVRNGAGPRQAPTLAERVDAGILEAAQDVGGGAPSAGLRARVRGVYLSFGDAVREAFGRGVVLVESEHFLIWTDWDARGRAQLARWCEAMYGALCDVFGIDRSRDVFLAKCPVFCWRDKARFRRFAARFDGFDATEAVGYTRSIQATGHVHVVLFRRGRCDADLNAFACTLVHEGSHAFIHRVHGGRLIPHWVNEGLAELVAERVLGDRCPTGENAALLARQYARYGWSIGDLLVNPGPIAVHQYALAHSLVAYLESLGRDRFSGFVAGLKEGSTIAGALADNYDGLTPAALEAGWRAAVAETLRTGP
ncbi:MAG: hypothetical protein ACE5E6_04165 [Phycisphaerae bacterium]